MGPKLYHTVTIFFGPHVPNFPHTPSSLLLLFSNLQRPPTCCSHPQDAWPEFGLHGVLSNSGRHCVDLSPIENYIFRRGPNFIIKSPSSLVHMFQTFYRRYLLCFAVFRLATTAYFFFAWTRLSIWAPCKITISLGAHDLQSTLSRFEPHGKL